MHIAYTLVTLHPRQRVYMCMRVCVYACIYAHVHVYKCLRVCVCVRVYIGTCERACLCACVRACVRVCVRACVRGCVRACVRVHVAVSPSIVYCLRPSRVSVTSPAPSPRHAPLFARLGSTRSLASPLLSIIRRRLGRRDLSSWQPRSAGSGGRRVARSPVLCVALTTPRRPWRRRDAEDGVAPPSAAGGAR